MPAMGQSETCVYSQWPIEGASYAQLQPVDMPFSIGSLISSSTKMCLPEDSCESYQQPYYYFSDDSRPPHSPESVYEEELSDIQDVIIQHQQIPSTCFDDKDDDCSVMFDFEDLAFLDHCTRDDYHSVLQSEAAGSFASPWPTTHHHIHHHHHNHHDHHDHKPSSQQLHRGGSGLLHNNATFPKATATSSSSSSSASSDIWSLHYHDDTITTNVNRHHHHHPNNNSHSHHLRRQDDCLSFMSAPSPAPSHAPSPALTAALQQDDAMRGGGVGRGLPFGGGWKREIKAERGVGENQEEEEEDAEYKPYCNSRRGAKRNLLWKFLLWVLDHRSDLAAWTDVQSGVFKFVDTATLSTMWGQRKQKRDMTFEKLSRGIRHYYKRELMERLPNTRLVYKFNWEKVPRRYRKA